MTLTQIEQEVANAGYGRGAKPTLHPDKSVEGLISASWPDKSKKVGTLMVFSRAVRKLMP